MSPSCFQKAPSAFSLTINTLKHSMIPLASVLSFFPLVLTSSSMFHLPDGLGINTFRKSSLTNSFWVKQPSDMLPQYSGHLSVTALTLHCYHLFTCPTVKLDKSFLKSKTMSYSSSQSPITKQCRTHFNSSQSNPWHMALIFAMTHGSDSEQSLSFNLSIWEILLWSLQPPLYRSLQLSNSK